MEVSLFLARAWGLYLFLICLGFLVNKKSYFGLVSALKNEVNEFIFGSIVFGVGVAQVVAYSDWSSFWTGLVTLFGWIALLKGGAILFVPSYLEKFGRAAVKGNLYMISLIAGVILGAYLLYVGYVMY